MLWFKTTLDNEAVWEDDDGFLEYVETSVQSGWTIFIATVVLYLMCVIMLFALLRLANLWGITPEISKDTEKKEYNVTQSCGSKSKKIYAEGSTSQLSCTHSAPSYIDVKSISATLASEITSPTALGSRCSQRRRRIMRKKHLAAETDNVVAETLVDIKQIDMDDHSSCASTLGNQTIPNCDSNKPETCPPPFDPELSNDTYQKLLKIVQWDIETKKLTKLMVPFVLQAASTGFLDVIEIAIIGKLIGTEELAAHVVVQFCLETSANIGAGFIESLSTLCSQSRGVGNKKLTGQYVQLAVVFYTLFWLPVMIFWVSYMDQVITLFGFDLKVGAIGKSYSLFVAFDYLLDGFGECVHALLDVIGKEDYSTFIGIAEEVTAFVTVLVIALSYDLDLIDIALIQLGIGVLFLLVNIVYIHIHGWFNPYLDGILGTLALKNKTAVFLMSKTALSISMGYLLTEGEWEVLAIFARFLGPAEVAAWGILGTIWNAFEKITEAVGDAAEIRVAFLLGSGQPARAKLSAYKSLAMGFYLAVFLASIVWASGNRIPKWITNDPTLQRIVGRIIPLHGFGILSVTVGMLCWPILGAQGRYRLATVVVCVASWVVTLPIAAIFSIVFHINLQGQTAAVIAGYAVAGTLNMFFMLISDWEALSKSVIAANEHANADDLDSESDNVKESTNSDEESQTPPPSIDSSSVSRNQSSNLRNKQPSAPNFVTEKELANSIEDSSLCRTAGPDTSHFVDKYSIMPGTRSYKHKGDLTPDGILRLIESPSDEIDSSSDEFDSLSDKSEGPEISPFNKYDFNDL